ncbi:hypothetical protein IJ531_02150, partial [bacterium]|nr:hypothetical protein [bacterium]
MLNFKKCAVISLIVLSFSVLGVEALSKTEEIDLLRADLACQKDKTSDNYIKTKDKLNKLILQAKIDYSAQSRLNDVERLIGEQKYNSAIYELNDLIDNNLEVSKASEILGDIYLKTSKKRSLASKYYKQSINADYTNISSTFKLAKLYLRENKNILGTEYLKRTIDIAKTT